MVDSMALEGARSAPLLSWSNLKQLTRLLSASVSLSGKRGRGGPDLMGGQEGMECGRTLAPAVHRACAWRRWGGRGKQRVCLTRGEGTCCAFWNLLDFISRLHWGLRSTIGKATQRKLAGAKAWSSLRRAVVPKPCTPPPPVFDGREGTGESQAHREHNLPKATHCGRGNTGSRGLPLMACHGSCVEE